MPARPITLVISCGSDRVVVTPCTTRASAKRGGESSDVSGCTCASMNPGMTNMPRASMTASGLAGVVADSRDERPAHGHVGLEHLPGEGREHPASPDEEGGLLETQRHPAALFTFAHIH